jgi:rubredoxin
LSWRTNRRTRKPFPVEDRWGNKLPDESPEELPSESQYIEPEYTCAGCGLKFSGQAYEIEPGAIVCSECNRKDRKIEMQERAREQAQQPTVPYIPYDSGSGKHRGGASSCSKCGHVYRPNESHEDHWRLHPD